MFLGANKVHAYFNGDCVECMACSDNVVRAGLTAKFVDVDTLVRMVDCTPGTAADQKLAPARTEGDRIRRYIPPVRDFAVDRVCTNSKTLTLPSRASPQIMLCTEGRGSVATETSTETLARGDVVFVVPDVPVTVSGDLTLFIAYSQG